MDEHPGVNGRCMQRGLIKLFKEINPRPIFVPWKRVAKSAMSKTAFNELRPPFRFAGKSLINKSFDRVNLMAPPRKYDKVPHDGDHGLSTMEPEQWMSLADAQALYAVEKNHLSGVGIVLTNGIHRGGDTLVGFDFDDVDFTQFNPPFAAYWERSPSGKGLRAFAWVPSEWAARFKDSLRVQYAHCSHVEVYLGTSARFLTLTGDVMPTVLKTPWRNKHDYIRALGPETLKEVAKWRGLQKSERGVVKQLPEIPDGGTELDLRRFTLSIEQNHLIKGTGQLDRSSVSHGLIIRLIDDGASQADILATIIKQPYWWQMMLDHRHEDPDRALAFAREEIQRAYLKSQAGMRANLIAFNRKEEPEQPLAQVIPIRGVPSPANVKPATSEPATSAPGGASTFPMELFHNAPGLVGEIAHWIMQASHAPREEFAYACAFSMMACLIGPYCTFGTRDGKTNLYIVLVGGTGTGKNEAIDPMCKLAAYTDAKDCIQDFPASEAALRRQLNVTPNILIRADELAHKIDSFKDSSNGSLLSKALLEMYGGARLPPKQYADEKKSLPAVENPFVQILGGTTDKVWEVLQTRHLEDGTLNRFIFVCLPEQAAYSANPRPSYKIDKAFKDRLNAFFRAGCKASLIGSRHVAHAPEVQAALEALGPVMYEKQQQAYGELYSRFTLHVEKIATILAVSDGRMITSMADYEQALKFMSWSVETTYAKASRKLAGSTFERSANRLIELLEKASGKMSLRELYKRLNKPRRDIEELISTLVMGGKIKLGEITKNKNDTETQWVHLLAPSEDE